MSRSVEWTANTCISERTQILRQSKCKRNNEDIRGCCIIGSRIAIRADSLNFSLHNSYPYFVSSTSELFSIIRMQRLPSFEMFFRIM